MAQVRIQRLVPGVTVLDGCIYIVGFVSAKAKSRKWARYSGWFTGHTKTPLFPVKHWQPYSGFCRKAASRPTYLPDINRDTFVKWSFISAMAVTGAYYDVPMGEVQKPGKYDTFIGLSQKAARPWDGNLGIGFEEGNIVAYSLKGNPTSLPQKAPLPCKDMARGRKAKCRDCAFDMIAAAEEQNIDIPTYRMVAEKFK